jgi:hypothetical protein
MTDFAALIEKAIEQDVRQRFARFLGEYEHVELGRRRCLTMEEAGMVLTCLDEFALHFHVLDLGVAEIKGLRTRLNLLTRASTCDISRELIVNTCFDALACIAALEARL